MRCIFCLSEKPGSEEHVFPLAIGGRLKTDRVCRQCNSEIGSRVDGALVNSVMVKRRRAALGLAGNHGKPPAVFEELLGVSTLVGRQGQRILTTYNPETGKLDIRALPWATDVALPNGTTGRYIVVDERDADKLPRIIQRERKQHGVPPLSPEDLAAEVRKFTENVIVSENVSTILERTYDFSFVSHALIKIAYELACLWLGDTYLDDIGAVSLRTAICSDDPTSTDQIAAWFGSANECRAFDLWSGEKDSHLALAFAGNDGIAIAVRIFDLHACVVWVCADASRYLSETDSDRRLRFLAIDTVERTMRNTTMLEEWIRLFKTGKLKGNYLRT